MHKTILIEEITIENVTEKINEKVQEMESLWKNLCKINNIKVFYDKI